MSEAKELARLANLSELVAPVDEKIAINKDASTPYVGLEHLGSRNSSLLGFSPSESSISVNAVFEAGDVLFGKLRPNLRKCVVAPFDGYCSTDILVLRAKAGNVGPFAARVFQSEAVGAEAERTSMGTKMPRTSWKGLSKFVINLPAAAQQTKIAEILDTLDAAIRGTEALVGKLRAMKQGLLSDLLTRGIDQNGDLRPPFEEAPHLYQETPLGWLPVGWVLNRLSNFAAIRGGKRLPAGHSYSSAPTLFRYLRVTDFFGKKVDLGSLESLEEATFNALGRYEIESGNLYISIAGSLGHVGVYEADHSSELRCILTENAARIVLVGEASPKFFSMLMNSASVQQQVEWEKGTGGGVPKLALFRIEQFLVSVPPFDEQVRIAQTYAALTDRITQEQTLLEKLRLQKLGLMEDLLTGRVSVTALVGA